MTAYEIALIPGDGIGTEVTPAATAVLDAAAARTASSSPTPSTRGAATTTPRPGGWRPRTSSTRSSRSDAILLGAVGRHDVPDHISLWGLLIPIRRHFRQYVNLRPVRLWEGVPSPLRDARRPTSTW